MSCTLHVVCGLSWKDGCHLSHKYDDDDDDDDGNVVDPHGCTKIQISAGRSGGAHQICHCDSRPLQLEHENISGSSRVTFNKSICLTFDKTSHLCS